MVALFIHILIHIDRILFGHFLQSSHLPPLVGVRVCLLCFCCCCTNRVIDIAGREERHLMMCRCAAGIIIRPANINITSSRR